FAQLAPNGDRAWIAFFHFPKELAGPRIESRVCLGAGVGLHIHFNDVRHFLLSRRIAVFLEAGGDEAELLSPVAEVIDALDAVSLASVEAGQRMTNHRGADVVEGDRLGDVRG